VTWFKIDDQFADHPKVLALLDGPHGKAALALWTLAGSWCSRQLTDGQVPRVAVARLGGTLDEARALVTVGLWSEAGDGFSFHQWTEHQPTREAVLSERERKARNQREARERRRRGDVTGESPGLSPVTYEPVTGPVTGDEAVSHHGPTRPDPTRTKEEEQGAGPPPFSRTLRDPMQPAAARPDVLELHAAWKDACGFPQHRFRGAYDADAGTLADAIQAYGLADCLLVAEQAPSDGMVSGKADERGRKHDTIRYIFGNADAFHRILRTAQEARGKVRQKRTAAELVREAKGL
jgi:hypothetical protein